MGIKKSRPMRIKFMFLLTAILATQYFFAQERNVKGRITDTNNLPIPGVNVIEKGTTNSIQTDINGEYTIKVSPTAIHHLQAHMHNGATLKQRARTRQWCLTLV